MHNAESLAEIKNGTRNVFTFCFWLQRWLCPYDIHAAYSLFVIVLLWAGTVTCVPSFCCCISYHLQDIILFITSNAFPVWGLSDGKPEVCFYTAFECFLDWNHSKLHAPGFCDVAICNFNALRSCRRKFQPKTMISSTLSCCTQVKGKYFAHHATLW